ncbi:hypothetical protein HOY80DRAFT_952051 [Tuber brumale]|nr:hypothetical protein HOY80DRAFT_952051 [Tuber brumale]
MLTALLLNSTSITLLHSAQPNKTLIRNILSYQPKPTPPPKPNPHNQIHTRIIRAPTIHPYRKQARSEAKRPPIQVNCA